MLSRLFAPCFVMFFDRPASGGMACKTSLAWRKKAQNQSKTKFPNRLLSGTVEVTVTAWGVFLGMKMRSPGRMWMMESPRSMSASPARTYTCFGMMRVHVLLHLLFHDDHEAAGKRIAVERAVVDIFGGRGRADRIERLAVLAERKKREKKREKEEGLFHVSNLSFSGAPCILVFLMK